jgi:hypothetical protein
VDAACCDDRGEACAGGMPSTCGPGCAAVLLPMQRACADFLVPPPPASPWPLRFERYLLTFTWGRGAASGEAWGWAGCPQQVQIGLEGTVAAAAAECAGAGH